MEGYENYDLQEEDPYLIPGSTCLINLLGIQDTGLLNQAEAEMSMAAYAELIYLPVKPTFDLDHLCQIHSRLLGDIYPWAGSLRQTEISKGGKFFLPWKLIVSECSQLFGLLHKEALLQGLSMPKFAARAAYYLGRINAIHPFREGNGRTQRIFLDQLAQLSGYGFEWSAVSGEQVAIACRQARGDDPCYDRLERLLRLHITEL